MINKSMIDKMLGMPDDKLLSMLKLLLSTAGVDLSGKRFDEKSVKKIRALLSEITDDDIGRVTYLLDRYRTGG